MPVRVLLKAAAEEPQTLRAHRLRRAADLYVDTYGDMYVGGDPPPKYRAHASTVITLKAQKAGS